MITARPSARRVVDHAREGVHRLTLTRQLHAVAGGQTDALSIDVAGNDADAEILERAAVGLRRNRAGMQRIRVALDRSGATTAVLDGLASNNPTRVARFARLAGLLRIDEAVGLLGVLLHSDHRRVADASARALGLIGGARSADALMRAIQRGGLRTRLVLELAKASPDLYLEGAMANPRRQAAVMAAAIASGLRRRQTAVGPLATVLASGTRRQRVITCRALGSIGGDRASSILASALGDREARVRAAAARGLKRWR